MRKITSFLAPRFTVPFSHGKDPHTFKVLRISSAADGKQMSPCHAQCAFSDATAWKCGCQLWNATPHMFYPTWIVNAHMNSMKVDFEFFSLLSAGQPRAGDRPGSTMDYTGVNTARNSHWLANKCFSYFCPGEVSAPFLLQCSWSTNLQWAGGECSELFISSFSTFCWG